MSAVAVAPVVRRLNQTMIDLYAAASGDSNPIHTNVEFANWLRNGSLDVRFRSPARPGDEVTASATFAREDGGRLRYSVECRNDKDEVLITGTAEVTPS
mgnify:CR=1 FL=1